MGRSNRKHADAVAVIGLGRFGGAVAVSLENQGHEVLAIDERDDVVQRFSETLTHVVQADSTSATAMKQLGVGEFDHVVVAIGTGVEASVLTVLTLKEIGAQEVWAKAITAKHGEILSLVGASHVVYPEAEMGQRVAHLVTGKMMDFIEFDHGFALAKTRAPQEAVGKTLGETKLRSRYGITVVGIKTSEEEFTYAQPSTMVREGDTLIVAGPTTKTETFASIT
ncbi:potassium channel family protein [Natronoglycomyces albus]|uniref:TrkA family potassium uptake protein n=1 Tax=Natronoglycomyces albus TaxID=2811108 RepID=A0A895XXJ3_9ACTN|nr:TrkA family potassium uptake protein [Natronoglycomyces albus]